MGKGLSADEVRKIKEYCTNQLDVALRSNDKKKEMFYREKLKKFNLFAVLKEKVKVEEVEKPIEKINTPGNIGKRNRFCVKCGKEKLDKRLSLCSDCRKCMDKGIGLNGN